MMDGFHGKIFLEHLNNKPDLKYCPFGQYFFVLKNK